VSFTVVGASTLGRGVIVRLDRLRLQAPDGSEHLRDVVRHPGGVGVLVVEDGRTWLVRQYRVAIGREVLEIPAGKRDADSTPLENAQRELAEELGMTASDWIPLGTMEPSPGYTDEVIHLFAASGIVAANRRPDGAEELESEVVEMSITEAMSAVDDGAITDAKTQLALLRWARRSG
jgi:ADP-ribose pyrophosphatase